MAIYGMGFIKGMLVTMTNMLRKPITVQYPEERLELPPRTRWALAPKYDEEGKPKCTSCLICEKECPDYIIHINSSVKEEGGKHIDSFYYEMGACMMCGLCVEACPFDAIEMSKEYELAQTDHDKLVRILLNDVDAASARKAREDKPAAPAAEGAAAAPAAAPAAPSAEAAPSEAPAAEPAAPEAPVAGSGDVKEGTDA